MYYEGKQFRSISNTENGEVTSETIFRYHQDKDLVWADYSGGSILLGTLIGKADQNGQLYFHYQHINIHQEIMTGVCKSIPEMMDNGKIRLHESWTWTSEDCSSGQSVIEEITSEMEYDDAKDN